MMNRREFVLRVGGLLLVLPAGWTVACGGGDSPGGGGTPPPGEGETLSFTSSNDAGHSHRVTLTVTSIDTPPAGGVSRTTTSDDGHVHSVRLSEAELQTLKGGGTVTKETSIASGHLHTFEFRR